MLPQEPLPVVLVREWIVNLHGEGVAEGRGQAAVGCIIGAVDGGRDGWILPNVLQFSAPTVPLRDFTIGDKYEYISAKESVHTHGNQSVRHILDSNGKRCGLWWDQAGYLYVGHDLSPAVEEKMVFVVVSRHEDMFKPRQGPSRVEGEIKLFDEDVYPSMGRGSGLVNVLRWI
ncbi:hypothetical protein MMYC01_204407 [Madurella mycetomatis]|uniref:Uncharacterized protein n=1 Tax=Madurella mycetomatis TaxID=100816 RepID=A0A175W4U0_9PEZI|nr:hypothetical protein MMYC01_204407 [Madurella mycetomatis]